MRKKNNRNIGTKITNKPVMNPEFDADVYPRPTVCVAYNKNNKTARIRDSFR